jgi:hypothetical protein
MNTSLYVLTGDYVAIANKLLESDLPPEVISDTLEGIAAPLEEKAVNVACFIRNLEASAESIKQAEKEMAERRKTIEAKAEQIKRYLFDSMKRSEIGKIESPYFTLSIAKNPPSVKIDDELLIPVEFMRQPEPPPPAPDKKLIADAIKSGKEIPGCHIENSERLVIK